MDVLSQKLFLLLERILYFSISDVGGEKFGVLLVLLFSLILGFRSRLQQILLFVLVIVGISFECLGDLSFERSFFLGESGEEIDGRRFGREGIGRIGDETRALVVLEKNWLRGFAGGLRCGRRGGGTRFFLCNQKKSR